MALTELGGELRRRLSSSASFGGEESQDGAHGDTPAAEAIARLGQGWTGEEVCELLEISEGHQRVLLHRGRSRVRDELKAYFAPADVEEAGPGVLV